ncbi:hypothetical protein RBH26_17645 [Natronolimnohabitans sp. A-GB9]|uniref:hypothetical protein n=1 Tax=Natronolimnohabitans sp. A-GB9 TaxID=3069757 RepID=UPI0027B2CC47|nr:hypothetical protein [Natronolimnohabitans sp. A-GB9]MDQ2052300.1 hypothetical protein [Natronolimnohabitans sp. A-GB9]
MGVTGGSDSEAAQSRLRNALQTVLFRTESSTVIEECRRCGTTRESGATVCPTCGSTGIARYHID